MKLNLKNPLVFFDLETTGTNINADRIVEICYLKVYPNGNEESKTLRINPGMHIPEASSAPLIVSARTEANSVPLPAETEELLRAWDTPLEAPLSLTFIAAAFLYQNNTYMSIKSYDRFAKTANISHLLLLPPYERAKIFFSAKSKVWHDFRIKKGRV